jgi:hypothetical protein
MVIHEQSKNALILPAQQQVKYVLDFETGKINESSTIYQPYGHKYHFQVDSRGNVKIQHIGEDWRGWNYPGQTRFSVNDNIPIPTYLVDMLKELISFREPPTYSSGFWDNNVINAFNKIKSGLKELANNPLDAADIKSQLGFSMNKNEILQNELKEMEQKCKNIQAAYVDTLKDNEKLKQEKGILSEKNTKLTHELNKVDIAKEVIKKEMVNLTKENFTLLMENNELKLDNYDLVKNKLGSFESITTRRNNSEFGPEFEPEFSDKFKTDYTHSHSLQDSYHNPGGATIYTKANAMNRMVFNPLLGIYEPGDEK